VIEGGQGLSHGVKVVARAGRIAPVKDELADGYELPVASQATLSGSAL
jgi:hypothetical protein